VLSAAAPASEPYKPDREAGMLLAFLIAAGAGALVGIFRELRDDSFHHVEQAKNMNMPVLASVPKASIITKFDKKIL
jgi:capsular polysaccharide biosynthesis protein